MDLRRQRASTGQVGPSDCLPGAPRLPHCKPITGSHWERRGVRTFAGAASDPNSCGGTDSQGPDPPVQYQGFGLRFRFRLRGVSGPRCVQAEKARLQKELERRAKEKERKDAEDAERQRQAAQDRAATDAEEAAKRGARFCGNP